MPATGSVDRLRLLTETGLLLSTERDLDVIVQAALDAGLALCGAAYGAFLSFEHDESYRLDKVSGEKPQWSTGNLTSGPTSIFASALGREAIVRSDDIAIDPRFVQNSPIEGIPPGEVGIRSYLAVPVISRSREALGALVYGHPESAVFHHETESLLATIAAQAAMAMENVRLREGFERHVRVADAARAEQRTADRRLRQALDAAQLGTWIWNASSGLIDFDKRAAELFEVEPHVPLSRDELWQKKVLEDDRGESPRDLCAILDVGNQYAAEYRIQTEDGGLRWIASTGMPTVDPITGHTTGMAGTVQDISTRRNQEESLRQSEKLAATGRLAATIAHEINNPLEAVTNLIYLAKTDPITPVPVQRMLETADSELARVSQIAQQTLGFYRDTTQPVSIDLNALLGAVVDLFGRKLAVKRLQVTLDLEPGLSVVGLQGEIRQVVSNLLVNAIDASPSNASPIRIRGRYRHRNGIKGVSVLISDQGAGIPSHVRSRLFTPFMTTKQSRGTGLGLWVTRGMVEKHGGTVRFRSCTENPAGTVFHVYLPQRTAERGFASPGTAVLQ